MTTKFSLLIEDHQDIDGLPSKSLTFVKDDGTPIQNTIISIDRSTSTVWIRGLHMVHRNQWIRIYSILNALQELKLFDMKMIRYTCLDSVKQKCVMINYQNQDSIWSLEFPTANNRYRSIRVDILQQLAHLIKEYYTPVALSVIA